MHQCTPRKLIVSSSNGKSNLKTNKTRQESNARFASLQKTVSTSQRPFKGRQRKPLKPTMRPPDCHLGAGIPPVENPASSSAEFQPCYPPTPSCPPQFIHSSLALFLQRTPLPFVCTTEILFGVRQTAVSSTSLSALFWYLFLKKLFVLFLLFVLMEALYVSSSSILHLLRAE